MNLFTLSAKIGIDTTEYEKNVKNAESKGRQLKDVFVQLSSSASPVSKNFSSVAKSFGNARTKASELSTEAKVLIGKYKEAANNVGLYTVKLEQSAKETGTASKQTRDLYDKLQKAKREEAKLKGQIDKLNSSLGNQADGFDEAGNSASTASSKLDKYKNSASKISSFLKSGLGAVAKGTGVLISGASAGIGALAKIGVEYNAQIENYTASFKTLMGSEEAATKRVAELREMAAKTPFGLEDLADATQTLLAYQVPAEKTNELLSALGDVALGNKQKLNGLAVAFGQVSAAGKIQGQDLLQMISNGYNPLNDIAKRTGESMAELRERMSEGKITAAEVEQAFKDATSEGGSFYKGMEQASKTTTGLLSTLKDNAMFLIGGVFEPLSNSLLQTVVPGAISAVDQLTTAFQEKGVTGLIEAAGTIISGFINSAVQYAPKMIEMAMTLINSLVSGFLTEENIETLATSAVSIITMLATNIMNMLPTILQAGITLIISLAQGIAESLPTLIPAAINAILTLVNTLIAPENLSNLIMAAVDIILALANGLIAAIPNLVSEIPIIIQSLVQTIIELLPELIPVALELMTTLGTYFITYIPTLLSYIPQVISAIFGAFKKTDWKEIGKNIMQGLKDGLTGMIQSIKDSVSNVASIIKDKFKSLLGIASPSKVFKSFGKFIDQGLSMGIEGNESLVERSVKSLSNTAAGFSVPTYSYNASTSYASAKPASQSAEHRKIVLDLDINDDGTGLARYLLKYLKVAEKEVYA